MKYLLILAIFLFGCGDGRDSLQRVVWKIANSEKRAEEACSNIHKCFRSMTANGMITSEYPGYPELQIVTQCDFKDLRHMNDIHGNQLTQRLPLEFVEGMWFACKKQDSMMRISER